MSPLEKPLLQEIERVHKTKVDTSDRKAVTDNA